MTKRIFLIHGWGGGPNGGWQLWLAQQLRKEGHDVTALAMPHTDHPKLDEWVETLRDAVGTPDEQCFFCGYSLGCITVLRYLETLQDDACVGGSTFVAGFYEHLGKGYEEIQPFIEKDMQWESIRKHCKHFAVVHSDDDPIVPPPFGQRLAQNLHTPVQLTTGKKHFGGNSGVTEVPEILSAIDELM